MKHAPVLCLCQAMGSRGYFVFTTFRAHIGIFSLHMNAERIAMKFGEVITTTNRWTVWVKLYQEQRSRIWQKMQIGIKTFDVK